MLRLRRTGTRTITAFAQVDAEMWRKYRPLGFLVVLLTSAACATSDACIEIRFEDGIRERIRREYVVSIDARLEVFAPREASSVTLQAPVMPSPRNLDDITRIRIATSFYKLDMDQAQCPVGREPSDRELTCYVSLSPVPLQMEVTYRRGTSRTLDDFIALSQEIARALRTSALACD